MGGHTEPIEDCSRCNAETIPEPVDVGARGALTEVLTRSLVNVSLLPKWMQSPALGRDMRPLAEMQADAILASDWLAADRAAAEKRGAERVAEAGIDGWPLTDEQRAHLKRRLAVGCADALREFADSRGVNVGNEDDEWWRGYRQAQRECLHDATNAADREAQR